MLLCLKEGEDFLHPTKPPIFPPTGPGQKERDLAQGPQTGWWRSPRHTSPMSNPELPLLLPFPVPPGPTHWLLNWLFVSLDSAGKIEADSKILTVCFPWGPFNFKCESTLEASRTFLRMPKLFLRPRGVKDSCRGGLHWSQLCPPHHQQQPQEINICDSLRLFTFCVQSMSPTCLAGYAFPAPLKIFSIVSATGSQRISNP